MTFRKLAKPWKRSRWHCRKCGIHTGCEYYSLHDELWQHVVDCWKMPVETLRRALMRDPQGRAIGPLGVVLDLVAEAPP